jgi:hypothetical protein
MAQLTSSAAFDDQILEQTEAKRYWIEDVERVASIMSEVEGATFFGRLRQNVKELRAEWGNMAVSMANGITGTVTGAMNGLSTAISNVIMGTQTAAEAFGQFALNMATSFIASVVQMVLMAKVAIPVLTALGVLSGGATAATGAAVTGASLGYAAALSSAYAGGLAEGGLIPGAPSDRDNRIAAVATGEYIARAAAVEHYGAGLFEALNQMRIPKDMLDGYRLPSWRSGTGAFSGGGLVQPGSAMGDLGIAVFDDRARMNRWLRSRRGRSVIFDINSGQALDLGIG